MYDEYNYTTLLHFLKTVSICCLLTTYFHDIFFEHLCITMNHVQSLPPVSNQSLRKRRLWLAVISIQINCPAVFQPLHHCGRKTDFWLCRVSTSQIEAFQIAFDLISGWSHGTFSTVTFESSFCAKLYIYNVEIIVIVVHLWLSFPVWCCYGCCS